MKAIVIETTGGPEQLSYRDVPDPEPEDGQVVVAIAAAGLNFIDTYHRSGLYPMDFPLIPGLEGAGSVIAVGNGVDGIAEGDTVAWAQSMGSYAEKKAIAADSVVSVPDSVDAKVAAAALLQGLTAHYLATDTFPLQPGDRCLIHAGAGGVGLLLTQIAVMRGAHVITTVGSDDKVSLSRDAGASEVINYNDRDFQKAIEDLFGPHAIDVVFDGVGGATFDKGLDVLRPRGMMVTFGNSSGPVPPVAPLTLTQKGSIFLTRPTMAHYLRTKEEASSRAADLFGWITDGKLDVRICDEFVLEDAANAHRALEGRQTTGKVVLIP